MSIVLKTGYSANMEEPNLKGLWKIPEELYRADKGFNFSSLKWLEHSPARYKYELENEFEPTAAMVLGKAIHCSLLEGEEIFSNRFTYIPEKLDRRTKEGKQKYDDILSKSEGREILSFDDWQILCKINNRINNAPELSQFFKGGMAEVSMFGYLNDMFCKGKFDYYIPEKGIMIDLKTTDNASKKVFPHSIYKFKYHVQAAYYSDLFESITGEKLKRYLIFAIEKHSICDVGVFEIKNDGMEYGRFIYRQWLDSLKFALKTNIWEGYERKIHEYEPNKWAMINDGFVGENND